MSSSPSPLEIFCDEAGHTGPDLLQAEQRYFAYGSTCALDDEAFAIIQKARADHQIQMPELKASKLLASQRGRRAVNDIFAAVEGRYCFNIYEKLLALCGWLFEYVYEPVYQDDPWFLYEKNLHRFVAMYSWLWFNEPDGNGQAKAAIEQFQNYMRSRKPEDAPFLFADSANHLARANGENPFDSILRFARGYREIIVADNARLDSTLPEQGRWILDLSVSALWSHLNYWGRQERSLIVRCDSSKPLNANAANMTGGDEDPGIARAKQKGFGGKLGYTLAGPIAFVDSRNHPAIQLADIVAGAAVWIMTHQEEAGCDGIAESLQRHILPESILPNFEFVDPNTKEATVNAVILYGLGERAHQAKSPYVDFKALYAVAETLWDKKHAELAGAQRQR